MFKPLPNLADYPMNEIPAGKIELRDDRVKTTWTVDIRSFWLAPIAVTNELYYSIVPKNVGLLD